MLLLENGIFIRNSTAIYIPLIQLVQSTIVVPASIQNISFGFDCLELSTDILTQLFSYISISEYWAERLQAAALESTPCYYNTLEGPSQWQVVTCLFYT